MRVALVNPPPRGEIERHWAPFPVLGLAYVAASLRKSGHEVTVLDGKLAGLSSDAIAAAVRGTAFDLVGITCMTVEFPAASRIASAIKLHQPSLPIVLGGAHVNAVGERVLHECASADFACIGEGEHLVCELADALERGRPLEDIPGLAHRSAGQVVRNRSREYHDDYDGLAFPAWDLFAVGDHIPLLTHRGCPFECNFCGHNSGFKPRYRSPENVLDEMEQVVRRFRPRTIRIEDETFGLNLPRTKAILQGVLERGLHRQVGFSAQTRVDRLDAELVQLLMRCNFRELELGVESGNEEVLARMGKGISLAQVEEAVRVAKQMGLRVWCKFILGHPHETEANIRDTADFIARLNPDRLSVSIMTPFPGTPIFDMAVRGEGGYRLLSSEWGDFDKYSSGVLELENVSLSRLKLYQIWCYLKLYLWNQRFGDLWRLAAGNRGVVSALLVQAATSFWRHGTRGAVPRRPVVPGVSSAAGATPALSDVAMPDATLLHIRSSARARAQAGSGAPAAGPTRLRTWAAPEA